MDQSPRSPEFDIVQETDPAGLGRIAVYSRDWAEIDEHCEVMEVERIFETDWFPTSPPFPAFSTISMLYSLPMSPAFPLFSVFPVFPAFPIFPVFPGFSAFPVFPTSMTEPMVLFEGDWVPVSEATEEGLSPRGQPVHNVFLESSSPEGGSSPEGSDSDGGAQVDIEEDRRPLCDQNYDSFITFPEYYLVWEHESDFEGGRCTLCHRVVEDSDY